MPSTKGATNKIAPITTPIFNTSFIYNLIIPFPQTKVNSFLQVFFTFRNVKFLCKISLFLLTNLRLMWYNYSGWYARLRCRFRVGVPPHRRNGTVRKWLKRNSKKISWFQLILFYLSINQFVGFNRKSLIRYLAPITASA